MEPGEVKRLMEGIEPNKLTVRALPLLVPEDVLHNEAEKKRVKRGLLGGSEEKVRFARVLYLPYLEFSYRYSSEKGLVSKQKMISEAKSAVLALREVDLGFETELLKYVPQLAEADLDPSSVVHGVDSTTLVDERLQDLKNLLSQHDAKVDGLTTHAKASSNDAVTKQNLKESIENLKRTKASRWNIFSDGLKLPSKLDLDTLELVDGSLFYIPYFIVRLSRERESRYLVWDRAGKEDDTIADELMNNRKFRDLVESRNGS